MVVHTPTKLDVLRQTAAANAAGRRAAEEAAGGIPPSVLAAQEAAGGVDGAPAASAVDPRATGATGRDAADLIEQDLDFWNQGLPAGTKASIEDEAETEIHDVNVTIRKKKDKVLPAGDLPTGSNTSPFPHPWCTLPQVPRV